MHISQRFFPSFPLPLPPFNNPSFRINFYIYHPTAYRATPYNLPNLKMLYLRNILAVIVTLAAFSSAAPTAYIVPKDTATNPISIPEFDVDMGVAARAEHLGARSTGLRCETSASSPSLNDIDLSISKVLYNKSCKVGTGPSMCNTLQTVGGSTITLCGKSTGSVGCHSVAWAAQQIRDGCAANGKAGGIWYFDGNQIGLRVVVN